MNTPATKYHVKQTGDNEWVIFGPGDVEFAWGFMNQEKADQTCKSMNSLMSEWPEEKVRNNA